MKNTLEVINRKLDDVKECISKLEDTIVEITEAKQKKEKCRKINEDSIKDYWDSIMHANIWIYSYPRKWRE